MLYSYNFKDPIDERDIEIVQRWIHSKDYSDKTVLSSWCEVIQLDQKRNYSLVFYKVTQKETQVFIEKSRI